MRAIFSSGYFFPLFIAGYASGAIDAGMDPASGSPFRSSSSLFFRYSASLSHRSFSSSPGISGLKQTAGQSAGDELPE
jgi:hypothetical protein